MEKPLIQPNRLRWVDVVRILGAFLVVVAHVQYSGEDFAWAGSFYFVLSRIAVPMFFMASGYLLLPKEEPYGVFFRKRAMKVVVPFVAWSVIYMLWKREYFDVPFSLDIAARYAIKILRGPRENHLWFFYTLIGLYLFTPILRVFVSKATRCDLAYFCGLWFLATPVMMALQQFTPLQFGFELYFAAGYAGYYLLGYLLGRSEFTRAQSWGFALLFAFMCVSDVAMIYLSSVIDYHTQYFGDYLSINIVLMSVSAFALLKRVSVGDRINALLAPLGRASFGIYLIHVIVLDALMGVDVFAALSSAGNSLYMIPLLGLLVFLISFSIVYVLQKIPFLRMIVP